MRFEPTGDGGGLRVHAPAKVNLYLAILGVRPDGYHEIDTLMQSVSLADTLEFRPAGHGRAALAVSSDPGVEAPPAGERNLVLRALRAVEEEALRRGKACGAAPAIRLHKRIPSGAGLGGGSSDAAATLLAMDRMWHLALGRERLEALARELGSDVAFFLTGGLARCTGRGEIVTPISETKASARFSYVLVTPPISVPTSLIYKNLKGRAGVGKRLTESDKIATMTPAPSRRGDELFGIGYRFRNDLQDVAFEAFPELARLYETLRGVFRVVQLSGSGGTFFGVAADSDHASAAAQRLREELEVPADGSGSYVVHAVSGVPSWYGLDAQ